MGGSRPDSATIALSFGRFPIKVIEHAVCGPPEKTDCDHG
jgi:hypothetical protein